MDISLLTFRASTTATNCSFFILLVAPLSLVRGWVLILVQVQVDMGGGAARAARSLRHTSDMITSSHTYYTTTLMTMNARVYTLVPSTSLSDISSLISLLAVLLLDLKRSL